MKTKKKKWIKDKKKKKAGKLTAYFADSEIEFSCYGFIDNGYVIWKIRWKK